MHKNQTLANLSKIKNKKNNIFLKMQYLYILLPSIQILNINKFNKLFILICSLIFYRKQLYKKKI